MKTLSHDNIRLFIGACIETSNVAYVMQHCQRGTLQVNLSLYIKYNDESLRAPVFHFQLYPVKSQFYIDEMIEEKTALNHENKFNISVDHVN